MIDFKTIDYDEPLIVYLFLFQMRVYCVYVPPAHCQIKGILQKIKTIKHRTIKNCLAIEYFSQRKQECTSDIRELVTLIEQELTQCISSLEAVLKTTHKMEEENKNIKA